MTKADTDFAEYVLKVLKDAGLVINRFERIDPDGFFGYTTYIVESIGEDYNIADLCDLYELSQKDKK